MSELPDDEDSGEQVPESSAETPGVAVTSRRRLLVGAALTAPIISLVAPSVMAAGTCSPSAMASATHSSHRPQDMCSGGLSPGYWMQTPDAWTPIGYNPGSALTKPQGTNCYSSSSTGATTFRQAFGTYPRSFSNWDGQVGGSITLMNAMREHMNTPEFHWIGALLNAANSANVPYPFTPSDIRKMWWNSPSGTSPDYTYLATNFFYVYLEG